MIEILVLFCALAMGIILGITGGGGSILTVPVLVYIVGLNPVIATAYSLFIVGVTSAFGTVQNYRKGLVDVKTALFFAAPSLIAIFLTRKFVVPAIPEILYNNSYFPISRDFFLMTIFATVMLMASTAMLRDKEVPEASNIRPNIAFTFLKIFGIGILIGLIGAGGGFLIIPALYYAAKLPMRTAIGTSLCIIAINSLIGFTGDIGNIGIDWMFLFKFSSLSVVGIFIGIYLGKFIDELKLKKIFGFFVLLMALLILGREIFGAFV